MRKSMISGLQVDSVDQDHTRRVARLSPAARVDYDRFCRLGYNTSFCLRMAEHRTEKERYAKID